MTRLTSLSRIATAAALAAFFGAGTTAPASAHSINACLADVADFCNTAHGAGSAAALNCIHTGQIGCPIHSHQGSSPGHPIDPNMTATPGHQLNKKKKGFKIRRR